MFFFPLWFLWPPTSFPRWQGFQIHLDDSSFCHSGKIRSEHESPKESKDMEIEIWSHHVSLPAWRELWYESSWTLPAKNSSSEDCPFHPHLHSYHGNNSVNLAWFFPLGHRWLVQGWVPDPRRAHQGYGCCLGVAILSKLDNHCLS